MVFDSSGEDFPLEYKKGKKKPYHKTPTSPKAVLIQMPKDVMLHIIGYLDFLDILRLRKVCHPLRDFLIATKPDSRIYEIEAIIDVEKISVNLNFDQKASENKYDYRNTRVKYQLGAYRDKKNKIFARTSILETFLADFGIVLRHQKTCLRSLNLIINAPNEHKEPNKKKLEFYKIFDCFKTLTTNYKEYILKIKSIHLVCKNEEEVLKVIPYLDPEYIESMKIDVGKRNGKLEFYEIQFLDQWAKAKEVELIGCFVGFWNFVHFLKVDISIQSVALEDIFEMKEILFQSPSMSHICINFKHQFQQEQDLLQRFGRASISTDVWGQNPWKTWYLKVPENGKVVKMELHMGFVKMEKMDKRDVPGNAIVVE